MNCWRHSLDNFDSPCRGLKATRVFSVEGIISQYCDECSEHMIKMWSRDWFIDGKRRPLDWEELPKDVIDLLHVQKS